MARRGRISNKHLRLLLGCISIALLTGSWELLADTGWIDIRFSSAPSLIFRTAIVMLSDADFWRNIGVSFSEFAWGMLFSCLIGVPLGILMGWFRRLRLFLEPIVMVFYSVPGTTFLPLIILWFGIDLETYAILVFLGAVFPVIVSTMAGMQQVNPVLVRAARSFCASDLGVFRHVLLPSSLPYVMTGIRLGLGRGMIGVILGEMYLSIAGVGHLIMRFQAGLNTDSLMVLVCFIAIGGVLMIGFARRIEERLRSWHYSREAD